MNDEWVDMCSGSWAAIDREFAATEREEALQDFYKVGRDDWPNLFYQNWCFHVGRSQFHRCRQRGFIYLISHYIYIYLCMLILVGWLLCSGHGDQTFVHFIEKAIDGTKDPNSRQRLGCSI